MPIESQSMAKNLKQYALDCLEEAGKFVGFIGRWCHYLAVLNKLEVISKTNYTDRSNLFYCE